MTHSLDELDADDWHYLGEGNKNLVLRYTGTQACYVGKVLRLRKVNEEQESSVEFDVLFIDSIMRPIIGSNYVLPITCIKTTRPFLLKIALSIEENRPLTRRHKRINTESTSAYLLTDLGMTQTSSHILFELKPKWGFKPRPYREGHIKRSVCRYCMHMHYRGLHPGIYCPLDLYSNDSSRIRRALDSLVNVYPVDKTLKASMGGIPFSFNDRVHLLDNHFDAPLSPHFMELLLESIIMNDPILNRLRYLQSTLDELDIEYIHTLYQKYKGHLVKDDIGVWEHVIECYERREKYTDRLPSTAEEEKQRIYEYVLSMTFKDCSVMIYTSTEPIDLFTYSTVIIDDRTYYYSVKLIDIDLKDLDKIPYWFNLDQSIVRYAIHTPLNNKHCV
ncbi:inositol-pentakisphosphate 2-kinase [Pilobolus umbonatus]|nr:inositol-pentakisphosphate 2-kinase [Pilobolus umbonatus]